MGFPMIFQFPVLLRFRVLVHARLRYFCARSPFYGPYCIHRAFTAAGGALCPLLSEEGGVRTRRVMRVGQ